MLCVLLLCGLPPQGLKFLRVHCGAKPLHVLKLLDPVVFQGLNLSVRWRLLKDLLLPCIGRDNGRRHPCSSL